MVLDLWSIARGPHGLATEIARQDHIKLALSAMFA